MTDNQPPRRRRRTRRHDLSVRHPPIAPGLAGDADERRSRDARVERYSPPPEPRPEWSRHRGEPDPTPTPERWYEPAPAVPTAPVPSRRGPTTPRHVAAPGTDPRRGPPLRGPRLGRHRPRPARERRPGSARQRPRPAPPGPRSVPTTSPSRSTRSSATIDVAAAVSPAVVRITTSGSVDTSTGVIPATGVGLGRHLRRRRLDPHQPPRRRGQRQPRGRAQRRPRARGHGLRHRHPDRPRHRQGRGRRTCRRRRSATRARSRSASSSSPSAARSGRTSNSVTSGIVSAKGRSITADGNRT